MQRSLQRSGSSPPFCSDTASHFHVCPALRLLARRNPTPAKQRQTLALSRSGAEAPRWLNSGAALAAQPSSCSCNAASPAPGPRPSPGFSPIAQPSRQCRCRSSRRGPQRSPLDRRKPSSSCAHSSAGAASENSTAGGADEPNPEPSQEPPKTPPPDPSAGQAPKVRCTLNPGPLFALEGWLPVLCDVPYMFATPRYVIAIYPRTYSMPLLCPNFRRRTRGKGIYPKTLDVKSLVEATREGDIEQGLSRRTQSKASTCFVPEP